MAKRSSVYFSKTLVQHTSDLPDNDSVSGRINRSVERYVAIVQEHGVELTDAEIDHINGHCDDFANILQIKYLAEEIRKTKSDVIDTGQLADKLATVTFADLVTLMESLGK